MADTGFLASEGPGVGGLVGGMSVYKQGPCRIARRGLGLAAKSHSGWG